MTVMTYMARQRARIRQRHEGEVYLYASGCGAAPVRVEESFRSAQEILEEMESLKGLNKAERTAYRERDFAV